MVEVLGSAGFPEVWDCLARENVCRPTSAVAVLRVVRAHLLYRRWTKVLLSQADVGATWLPWHASEGGRIWLVPPCGSTVNQAVARFRSLEDEFARGSSACCEKIMALASRAPSPIFLSAGPVDMCGYRNLRVRGEYEHLDGLHRLVAWELNRQRYPDSCPETLVAYVAGLPA